MPSGRPPHLPSTAAAQLQGVNERLSRMIDTLRRGREQMLQSRSPVPGWPAPGLAVVLPGGDPAGGRSEDERLRARVAELEAAQQQTADELVEVEQQLTHVAVLFAALRQLHEAVDRPAAVEAIGEIVVNLVGSEELAVLEVQGGGALRPVRTMGIDPDRFAGLRLGAGPLGEAVAAGAVLTAPDRRLDALGSPPPVAVVPLRAGGVVVGAVVLLALLGHKEGLAPRDLEVLDLLSTHAASALRATAPHGGADDGAP